MRHHHSLEKLYFTTSNNLTKNLCVASVSSYSTSSLKIRKKAKNGKERQFWVRYPYHGCQNEPLQYFWTRCFHISETHRCSNKRIITGKTASVCVFFYFFWQNTGPKNRDYINPKDSRPTVGRFIGRSSADLSADKMPDFSSFFIGRQKINYNYLVIIFFPSADSFGVLAIGR